MSRRSVLAAGCALGVVGTCLLPVPAAACSRVPLEPFEVDSTLAAADSQAPEAFREITALTHRIEAERCVNGVCTASSCGDAGVLELRFRAPAEAASGELGYRMLWLGGELPDALRERLGLVLPLEPTAASDGPSRLSIDLGWRGVTELDGELALVAVDRAGNESEPSDPVRVTWSGCTDYYDDPFCLDGAAVSAHGHSCSVSSGPRGAPSGNGSVPLGAAVLLGAVLGYGWRSSRNRSAGS